MILTICFSGVEGLACWIGFHSVSVKEFHLRNCTDLSGFRVMGVERSWGSGVVGDGTDQEFVCSKTPEGGTLVKVLTSYKYYNLSMVTIT